MCAMRRNKLILLAVSILVISCEEIPIIPSNDSIMFGTELTKGTIVGTAADVPSISMFAKDINGTFANNLSLVRGSTSTIWSFKPSDNITWPLSKVYPLHFIGHSPKASAKNGLNVGTDAQGMPIYTYTAPEIINNQPDFMLSSRVQEYRVSVVPLQFKHQLSKISFAIKGDNTRKIQSITIKDIVRTGTLKLNSITNEYEWTLGVKQSNFTASINDELEDITPDANPNIETDITTNTGHLFMLPQDVGGKIISVTVSDIDDTNPENVSLTLPATQEWEIGEGYTYTIELDSDDAHIDCSQYSNCYLMHPAENVSTYYIPIDGRINQFWGNYGYEDNPDYTIADGNIDGLSSEIIWHDCQTDPNINVEIVNSGFTPKEIKRPFSMFDGDLTPIGTTVALKITGVNSGTPLGNVVVAVKKNGIILWSWHLWITNYNPDAIVLLYSQYFIPNKAKRYTASGTDAVDRYTGALWSNTGLYKDKFIMDRNIGARDASLAGHGAGEYGVGALYYQYGRKDPFPGNAASGKGFLINIGCDNVADAVKKPMNFATNTNWTDGKYNEVTNTWNDPMISKGTKMKKSIFDPSPLGWCVPQYETWSEFNETSFTWNDFINAREYGDVKALYHTSGCRNHSNGILENGGSKAYYWSNTNKDASNSYVMSFDKNTLNTCTLGNRTSAFPVRAIQE